MHAKHARKIILKIETVVLLMYTFWNPLGKCDHLVYLNKYCPGELKYSTLSEPLVFRHLRAFTSDSDLVHTFAE